MFLMDTLSKVLFFVFLVGSMLGIGLKVGRDDLLSVLRDKGWLARMLIANLLVIPAVGILATRTLPLKPENALALTLLACAPGGLGALQFLTKHREQKTLAYAAGAATMLSFLSVAVSPFLISAALPRGMAVKLPYVAIILFLLLTVLLPLLLGVLIGGTAGAPARKLARPIAVIATLAFVGLIVKMGTLTKWAKAEVGGKMILVIVLFVLISMLVGWLLGGPGRDTRKVLADASSIRNVALCMAIAVRSFPDPAVLTPLLAFAAIMIPANMLFLILSKVGGKIGAKRAAVSPAPKAPVSGP